MEFKFITTDQPEYLLERELRAKVLREPMGLSAGAEIFPFEDEALHLIATEDGNVIGCVMFKPEKTTGRMLQMAVKQDRQKNGVGTQLVEHLENHLRSNGYHDIYLHARDVAMTFYERLGYELEGEPFIEVGIPHRLMRKQL